MPRKLILVSLLLVSQGITIVLAETKAAAAPAFNEQQLVRLVRLAVLLEAKSPGGCDAVGEGSIELTEDGRTVESLRLEPGRTTTVHAILMDRSHGMLRTFQAAKRAARAYIEALPPDEPALLAGFDDSLILHSSLSTDRMKLEDDLFWIESGWGSNLWDASYQMIRYLSSRPERKALLLLTDGCDTQKSHQVTASRVVELADRTPSLVVFPVGFRIPSECSRNKAVGPDLMAPLKLLAVRTGGHFTELDSLQELDSTLRGIRERLDGERHITYRPVPFGSGPKDRADRRDHRWRALKVRLRGRAPCAIRLPGQARRYASAELDVPAVDALPAEASVIRAFAPSADGKLLRGEILDIVRDSGPLLKRSRSGFLSDNYEESPRRQSATREVAALVPPIEWVVRPEARPEDAFLSALAGMSRFEEFQDFPSTSSDAKAGTTPPFIVHGRSFHALRSSLALALAEHPDYASWARKRVRLERLAELRALGDLIDTQQLEAIGAGLEGEGWRPEPRELERYLAAWLGDVPAVELYTAGEGWFARRLLEAAGDLGQDSASVMAEAERLWKQVATWMPPPVETRLLAFLVPGYDPAREVIGYYRVVQPRPDSFLGAWHFSADAPLGVRFLSWMLRQPAVAELIKGRLAVQRVHYEKHFNPGLNALLSEETRLRLSAYGDWSQGLSVTLTFEDLSQPGRLSSFIAHYQRDRSKGTDGDERFCLVLPRKIPEDGIDAALWSALTSAKARSTVPCVLKVELPEE